MSVITETEPGGEIVCILSFSARPRDSDNGPMPDARRDFQVGERVRYISSFFKKTPEDNPTGHMVVFEPVDGRDKNRFAATQTYFVTLECWEGLKKHFASTLIIRTAWDVVAELPEEGTYTLVEVKKAIPRGARVSSRSGERARKNA
jgi:hypothetical protein